MKKLSAILLALTMLFISTACERKKQRKENNSSQTVKVTQTSYSESPVNLGDNVYIGLTLEKCGDMYYFFYKTYSEMIYLARIDSNFNVVDRYSICPDYGFGAGICIREDGSFSVISVATDFVFEKDEYGVITNHDKFIAEGDISLIITDYDSSVNIVNETEILEIEEYFDKASSFITGFYFYGEGKYLFNFHSGLAVINSNGITEDVRNYDELYMYRTGIDSDGNILVIAPFGITYLDGETAELPVGEKFDKSENLRGFDGIASGNGDFKNFFKKNDGIYGMTDSGELVLVFDFSESMITYQDVSLFASCGDGQFITSKPESNGLNLYIRRPDDYTNNRETIEIWEIGGCSSHIKTMANQFSKSNDHYIADVTDSISADALRDAVLTGEVPDIAIFSPGGDVQSFLNLGTLEDMGKLMDGDKGISREDFMPNVLEAFEYDGRIYNLPIIFNIEMMIANRNVISSEYKNWTFDDFYRFHEKRPDDMTLTYNFSPDILLYNSLSQWINYDKHTCNFDNKNFIKLLNFCKDNQQEEFYEEESTSLGENIATLGVYTSTGLYDVEYELLSLGLSPEETVFLNYPNSGGKGMISYGSTFSVMSDSDCKDGAWEFLSYIYSDKYLLSAYSNAMNFVNKKAFESGIRSYIAANTNYDESVIEKQAEEYVEYVKNCTVQLMDDYDIKDIINDEYNRFLNDQITAEECAQNLQSRIEILLAEQT